MWSIGLLSQHVIRQYGKTVLRLVFIVFCITLSWIGCADSAFAQRSTLQVVVVNLENHPIAQVALNIKGSNVTSPLSDKLGRTQLKIPAGVLPGQTICLRIAHGAKGMLVI